MANCKHFLYAQLILPPFFAVFWFCSCALAGPYLFGITIDDPWTEQEAVQQALAAHKVKPTARIVFDEHVPAAEYLEPVASIHASSHVMGEILDSFYVADYSVDQYLQRTAEYIDTLADRVDIWEIGNEVNGDWLGSNADVRAKIEGAYALAEDRGLTTAINFYYNAACSSDSPEHEMFTWIEHNISQEMKNGLDYVFFSYYEDDCKGVAYSRDHWQEVFARLHTIFPGAKLGFGEIGTTDTTKKAAYIQRYYSITFDKAYYVGGFFWWYYRQDCVPHTAPLWSILDRTVTRAATGGNQPLPAGSIIPAINSLLIPPKPD
ncbi:MAG: hypothetical protein DSY70_01150 [Desulfobulbus sp.]|nr:MAG: hypothetical protein DSY70_01150 [Desulfobulbus sp.]